MVETPDFLTIPTKRRSCSDELDYPVAKRLSSLRLDAPSSSSSSSYPDFNEEIEAKNSIQDDVFEEDLKEEVPRKEFDIFDLIRPRRFTRKIDFLEDELIRKSRRFSASSFSDSSNYSVVIPASTTGNPFTDKALSGYWESCDERARRRRKEEEINEESLLNESSSSSSSSSNNPHLSGQVTHRGFIMDDIVTASQRADLNSAENGNEDEAEAESPMEISNDSSGNNNFAQ